MINPVFAEIDACVHLSKIGPDATYDLHQSGQIDPAAGMEEISFLFINDRCIKKALRGKAVTFQVGYRRSYFNGEYTTVTISPTIRIPEKVLIDALSVFKVRFHPGKDGSVLNWRVVDCGEGETSEELRDRLRSVLSGHWPEIVKHPYE